MTWIIGMVIMMAANAITAGVLSIHLTRLTVLLALILLHIPAIIILGASTTGIIPVIIIQWLSLISARFIPTVRARV